MQDKWRYLHMNTLLLRPGLARPVTELCRNWWHGKWDTTKTSRRIYHELYTSNTECPFALKTCGLVIQETPSSVNWNCTSPFSFSLTQLLVAALCLGPVITAFSDHSHQGREQAASTARTRRVSVSSLSAKRPAVTMQHVLCVHAHLLLSLRRGEPFCCPHSLPRSHLRLGVYIYAMIGNQAAISIDALHC